MPKMSEINAKTSKYFKVKDLEEATGQKWQISQLPAYIADATIGEYPARDNEPAKPAYFLHLNGHEKPLGCNWTNRTALQEYLGDVEWDRASMRGLRLIVYAAQTSMGPGIKIRIHPEQTQEPFAPKANALVQPPLDEPPPPSDADAPPPPTDDDIPF